MSDSQVKRCHLVIKHIQLSNGVTCICSYWIVVNFRLKVALICLQEIPYAHPYFVMYTIRKIGDTMPSFILVQGQSSGYDR